MLELTFLDETRADFRMVGDRDNNILASLTVEGWRRIGSPNRIIVDQVDR